MAVLDWPSDIELFQVGGWVLDAKSTTAGRGLDGVRQIINKESRYWKSQFQVADIWGLEDAPKFHAFMDQCKGASGAFRIPVYNEWTFQYTGDLRAFYLSVGMTADEIAAGAIFYDDGASFDDGSGFAPPDYAEPITTAAAAAGDTYLSVTGFIGEYAKVGSLFSVNDFLYRIYENTVGNIKFNPPLREAISSGTTVNISKPNVQVRFESDEDAEVFASAQWGLPMFNVVEVFQR